MSTARHTAYACLVRAAVEVTRMVRSDWQIIWDPGLCLRTSIWTIVGSAAGR
ncbi:hypothetical protein JG687_00010878 [Phytophthora cactorum]|uniref:Uncharacterized protein n=1 Tax=Phytophthora cactorum TaxID=29920 RepID=A0A8T1U8C3_9STRA|nr:hypothetical protein JG687_00010878 [Phytophthora cactorum]